jgi:hypothetical protein
MTVAKLFLPIEIVEIVVVVVIVIVVVVVHHGDHIEDSVDGNDSKSHEAEKREKQKLAIGRNTKGSSRQVNKISKFLSIIGKNLSESFLVLNILAQMD